MTALECTLSFFHTRIPPQGTLFRGVLTVASIAVMVIMC